MIPDRESLTVEFKSDVKKLPDSEIFEAVVALANTDGGDIYLGVENDGSVTGVHESHKNPLTLGAYVANNTVPPISIRTEVLDGEKAVLKISVSKSTSGISSTAAGKILRRQIKLDGTPENTPMYPTELITRLSGLRLLDYSATLLPNASIEAFDPIETGRLRSIILAYDGERALLELQDEDLYKALGFAKEANGRLTPTIAGLLMLGRADSLAEHIPTHQASFQVLEGTSVIMNEDFILPLLAAFERFALYIDAHNPEREYEIGLFRMSAPAYNKRALREAMINAFSHRDYTRMGRVRICIADEGLTISNPGGFMEGVTIDNLLTAEPYGRNPLLADALKRVGLAEKTGRGIDRIYEGSLIYGNTPPDYSASGPTVVSVLLRQCKPDPLLTSLISNEQKRLGRPLSIYTLLVLHALREAPGSNVQRISEITKQSVDVISSILEATIENGLVLQNNGKGKAKTYTLSSSENSSTSHLGLYTHQRNGEVELFCDKILQLASTQAYVTRADVANLLQVSTSKAYRLLKRLADKGLLEPVNRGRYAKYRLVNSNARL